MFFITKCPTGWDRLKPTPVLTLLVSASDKTSAPRMITMLVAFSTGCPSLVLRAPAPRQGPAAQTGKCGFWSQPHWENRCSETQKPELRTLDDRQVFLGQKRSKISHGPSGVNSRYPKLSVTTATRLGKPHRGTARIIHQSINVITRLVSPKTVFTKSDETLTERSFLSRHRKRCGQENPNE